MQLINCPWCGPREETEFHYGGEAHVAYPADPQSLTDEQWAHYGPLLKSGSLSVPVAAKLIGCAAPRCTAGLLKTRSRSWKAPR